MISTVLAMSLAASAMQSDTTRAAREAYQACLRQFLNQHVATRTAIAEFETALPQQCSSEAAAYRAAIVRREGTLRATRPNAERAAEEALGDTRNTYVERYRFAMEPQ